MSLPARISLLTPKMQASLREQILKACQSVVKETGLVLEDKSEVGSDIDLSFELVFRVSIPDSDGKVFDTERERFMLLAARYGLEPSDYGREFKTGGEKFKIVGVEPRRPRYPISVERIPDRRRFKFTAENVSVFLKAGEGP